MIIFILFILYNSIYFVNKIPINTTVKGDSPDRRDPLFHFEVETYKNYMCILIIALLNLFSQYLYIDTRSLISHIFAAFNLVSP